jgi:hypothetical protein
MVNKENCFILILPLVNTCIPSKWVNYPTHAICCKSFEFMLQSWVTADAFEFFSGACPTLRVELTSGVLLRLLDSHELIRLRITKFYFRFGYQWVFLLYCLFPRWDRTHLFIQSSSAAFSSHHTTGLRLPENFGLFCSRVFFFRNR